jgi:hypothetical protein
MVGSLLRSLGALAHYGFEASVCWGEALSVTALAFLWKKGPMYDTRPNKKFNEPRLKPRKNNDYL